MVKGRAVSDERRQQKLAKEQLVPRRLCLYRPAREYPSHSYQYLGAGRATADDACGSGVRRSGRSDVLWTELPGPVPARRRLCRQDFARGEAGRHPGRAASDALQKNVNRLAEQAPRSRVLARPQPVKVEADDVAARERSREQAGPLSVARLPHGDAVPQPLVHAFAVAARYRGERRFKVLFQQCQTRRLGQVNWPRQIETPRAAILMASFR